jgi:hypothetical protein
MNAAFLAVSKRSQAVEIVTVETDLNPGPACEWFVRAPTLPREW